MLDGTTSDSVLLTVALARRNIRELSILEFGCQGVSKGAGSKEWSGPDLRRPTDRKYWGPWDT